MKSAKILVVAREWALALQHFDLYPRLVVAVGGKDLRFTGWDSGVARDHRRGYASGSFNRQRKRRDVEKQHILHVALQHTALNGRADRHHFIRVHPFVRLFAD